MARELSEDDLKRWHDKFEQKKDDLDADTEEGTPSVTEHDGARVMLGDRSEGSDEWLTYEEKSLEDVLKP